ncbi:hypothetical protein JCM10450v2_007996 [Rhodotorula kratochvilovae]
MATSAVPNTLAPLILGLFLSTFVLGATALQALEYFTSSAVLSALNAGRNEDGAAKERGPRRRDPPALVALVGGLVGAVLLVEVLAIVGVYNRAVSRWGDSSALSHPHWSISLLPVIGSLVACAVQQLFSLRLARLVGNRDAASIISLVSGAALAFAATTTVALLRASESDNGRLRWCGGLWLVLQAAADVLIWVFFLVHDKTFESWTHSRFQRIKRYARKLNGLSMPFSIVSAIVFFVRPHELWFALPALSLPPLYLLGALLSLNSRRRPSTPPSPSTSFAPLTGGIITIRRPASAPSLRVRSSHASFGALAVPLKALRTRVSAGSLAEQVRGTMVRETQGAVATRPLELGYLRHPYGPPRPPSGSAASASFGRSTLSSVPPSLAFEYAERAMGGGRRASPNLAHPYVRAAMEVSGVY